jgi:precorrin-6B methylase 2
MRLCELTCGFVSLSSRALYLRLIMVSTMPEPSISAGPTPEKILQVGLGFWGSKVLLSAVELGLFTALGKGPVDFEALTAELKLHPRGARDFLDSLVAMGFLEREGVWYSNTVDTSLFLDRNKPSYLGGLLEMANARLYPYWGSLTEALRTGQPQNEVKQGGKFFEKVYADPDKLRQFLSAMTGISLGAARAIASKFPWAKYRTFVDAGCAQGGLPVQVALAHAHLQGIGFDVPPVRPVFEEYVASFGLGGRLRFQEGDFVNGAIPSADVIVMGHVLHDWDLETKRMLLKKAHAALPAGGSLIIYEALIDDERRTNAFGLLVSLNMLIETPGGFDYTGADCQGWMRDAGFRETRVEHLLGPDSMVIGVK